MSKAQVGLVGLAVMGENLALNIEEKGFPIAVFNRTVSKVDDFVRRNPGKQLLGCRTIPEFVAAIERPRPIILMVKAGEAVDREREEFLVAEVGERHIRSVERRIRSISLDLSTIRTLWTTALGPGESTIRCSAG